MRKRNAVKGPRKSRHRNAGAPSGSLLPLEQVASSSECTGSLPALDGDGPARAPALEEARRISRQREQ